MKDASDLLSQHVQLFGCVYDVLDVQNLGDKIHYLVEPIEFYTDIHWSGYCGGDNLKKLTRRKLGLRFFQILFICGRHHKCQERRKT